MALYTRLVGIVVDAAGAGAGVGADPTVGRCPWLSWTGNSGVLLPSVDQISGLSNVNKRYAIAAINIRIKTFDMRNL